jgi:drug/metabolite transporter superfamily protein YnfA
MKKIILLFAGVCLCLAFCSASVNFESVWQRANDCYNRKVYDSAAYYYEQLAALKPHNATVYFNLGNAYYRLNKIAPAVVNYRRALQADPDMKLAQENLMLTQTRIASPIAEAHEIFFLKWWDGITRQDKAAMWGILALVFFTLIMAVLFVKQFSKTIAAKIPQQVYIVLALAWLFSFSVGWVSAQKSSRSDLAVVKQNEVPLMTASLTGKPITTLPEGTTVTVVNTLGIWVEVRLTDGRTGYVQDVLLERV